MIESQIVRKYPSYRDAYFKSCQSWIESKRLDDNAEGLWRVHDKLYDLKKFVKHHPGGSAWIEMSEGIDITEQFETHHLTGRAEEVLKKFYVRNASKSRNYKITFESDGFYKTLKGRVANKLRNSDTKAQIASSKIYFDLMLAATLLSLILVSYDRNFFNMILSSACLTFLTIIAHNFIHQKDNWRMYLVNFSMQNFRDWRVFHAMSHHMYPNSLTDLETSLFEPYLNWHPKSKSLVQKYSSAVISPLVYCFIYPVSMINRISGAIIYKWRLYWDDLLPFVIPFLIYTIGHNSFLTTLSTWLIIISWSSFIHGLIAVNVGHHHTNVFHDNDELQSLDYGVYQLSATSDKKELPDNHFFTLTTFGQHILHHMFPMLDHAVLPQFKEILSETCKEFEVETKIFPWYQLLIGQFYQLRRTKPKKIKNNE